MKNSSSIFLVMFCITTVCIAQIPTDVPNPANNTPVDFSKPADVIIFIVIPILVVIFLLIWRNKRKNG